MSKLISTTVAVAALTGALLSTNSHAAEGSITFSGTVVASTCTADVNGQGPDGNVRLETVSWDALQNVGDTAGDTPFSITLAGCNFGEDGDLTIRPKFEQTNVSQLTGNLQNVSGGMGTTDVEIQILNNDQQPIDLRTNANNNPILTDESVVFDYYGRYIRAADGGEVFGDVGSVLMFSVEYQ
ncbi:fimbrial protein [Zestomonas carbonaria]|uniref:Fimbrial-type adhesion domain-containing protein n=1 Tax=Zestomonas carbonaria TaxID=2762745 RepID=A0A7U7IBR0_9GAMM|nr:fimbrial protein [Pseudomonas carbonaria]CAD5110576.1 hypothetical protein PSEWESI4_04899 [Pseudomonas carbonaria]